MDLQDGQVTAWYGTHESVYVTLLGMDSEGHPLLEVTTPHSSNPRVILIPASERTVPLDGPGPVLPQPVEGYSVSDDHGTWVATRDGGVWLYEPKVGIRRVAQLARPPRPSPVSDVGVPGIVPVVAGTCLQP